MPGPHLEMKFYTSFEDVGGCDCWISSFYTEEDGEWWCGWHMDGRPGIEGLQTWEWPNGTWLPIGYERWAKGPDGKDWVVEAFYAIPNPSTVPPADRPTYTRGHWHVWFGEDGHPIWSRRSSIPLRSEELLYLKGGVTEPYGGRDEHGIPRSIASKGANFAVDDPPGSWHGGKGRNLPKGRKGDQFQGKGYTKGNGKDQGKGKCKASIQPKGPGRIRIEDTGKGKVKGKVKGKAHAEYESKGKSKSKDKGKRMGKVQGEAKGEGN